MIKIIANGCATVISFSIPLLFYFKYMYMKVKLLTIKPVNLIGDTSNIQRDNWIGKHHERLPNHGEATTIPQQ